MTRCILLDGWFDAWSKDLDEVEKNEQKDLITGEKNA